jgi:hypothetical protein
MIPGCWDWPVGDSGVAFSRRHMWAKFPEGSARMWKTIGWLTLTCAIFIGLLISLAIIGLNG